LVEQRIENPRVTGSIPVLGTIFSLSGTTGCDDLARERNVTIFALGVIPDAPSVRMKIAKGATFQSLSFGVRVVPGFTSEQHYLGAGCRSVCRVSARQKLHDLCRTPHGLLSVRLTNPAS
jgi:hypothetical protein